MLGWQIEPPNLAVPSSIHRPGQNHTCSGGQIEDSELELALRVAGEPAPLLNEGDGAGMSYAVSAVVISPRGALPAATRRPRPEIHEPSRPGTHTPNIPAYV